MPAQERAGLSGLELGAAALAALVVGPLTLALGLAGARLARGRPLAALAAALPGLGLAALLASRLRRQLRGLASALALRTHAGSETRLLAAWPHLWPLWLTTLPLAPLGALVLGLGGGSLDDDPDAARWRQLERLERRLLARLPARAQQQRNRDDAAFLGYRLGGDRLLPERRGRVYLPLSRLGHHLLVVGATGSGKTETVLRLVDSVARASDWRLVFIDGKADRETAARFVDLAAATGRSSWVFPGEAYDGWRGDAAEVAGRLLQLVDFADSGGGAYYRDLAVNAVRLACGGPAGPPRSSRELLRRLRPEALVELYSPGSLEALEAASFGRGELDGIRARYAAFFATVGSSLDGATAFDELESAYFLLDGLRLKQEAGYLARFLVEEFTQWAVGRKPRAQRVLLVVDEFSALAVAGRGLVDVVERTRAFGVAAVLCPQLAQGMGSAEASARLIGSAQTILLHAMATPERFVEAAGGRRVAETTLRLEGELLTGAGSVRSGWERRVDPDEVRRLRPGQCFAIGSGRAQKLQVAATARPAAAAAAAAQVSPASP